MELWSTIEPYVIGFFPVAIGIAAVYFWRRGKRARQIWQVFAQKHGFEYTPPEPPNLSSKSAAVAFQDPGVVSGELDDLAFSLRLTVSGSRKNRRVFTSMSVDIPRMPSGLRIYHQNAFLQLTKLFGAQDVNTGDKEFDDVFVVKGENPAEVSAWLDQSRRRALLRVLSEDSDMLIQEGRLEFRREEIVANEEVLEKELEAIRALVPYIL